MASAAIAGVATWLGSVGVSAGIAGFVASVAVYAAVGAVVGGIGAAVMGGDIGKGILFGAIGGAVAGGISGALANVGTTAASSNSQLVAGATATSKTLTPALMEAKAAGMGVGAGAGAGAASGIAPVLAQGAVGIAGSMLDAKEQAEQAEKNRKFEMEKLDKLHEQNLEKIAAQQAGGGVGAPEDNSLKVAELNAQLRREELEEQRRQYNVAREDALAKVETRKSALMGMRAARTRGQLQPGQAQGIDRQGNKDIPGLFGEVTVDEALVDTGTPAENPAMKPEEEEAYA